MLMARPLVGLARGAVLLLLRCRSADELASLRRSLLGLFVIGMVVLYIPIAEVALQPFTLTLNPGPDPRPRPNSVPNTDQVALEPFACEPGNDGVWRMTAPSSTSIVCYDWDGPWAKLQVAMPLALSSPSCPRSSRLSSHRSSHRSSHIATPPSSLLPSQGPAVVAAVVYVVGVPLGVLCTLWVGYQLSEGRGSLLLNCVGARDALTATDAATGRRRVLSRGMLEPTWREAFGPLYTSYHHTSCLWEVVMMVRKVSALLHASQLTPPRLSHLPQAARGSPCAPSSPAGEPGAGARLLRDGAGGAGEPGVHHPHRLARDAARVAPVRPQARERHRERLAL